MIGPVSGPRAGITLSPSVTSAWRYSRTSTAILARAFADTAAGVALQAVQHQAPEAVLAVLPLLPGRSR